MEHFQPLFVYIVEEVVVIGHSNGNSSMRKFLKTLLTICVIFTLSACVDEDHAEDPEDYETEDITEEMTTHWMDQRDEFIELAENQIEDFEEKFSERRDEIEDEEKVNELEGRLDDLSENLSDLEAAEEEHWQEKRDDIAGAIYDIQTELEDL